MKIATVNGSPKIDIKLYVHTQDANIRMKIYMLKMFHKNYIYAHEMFGSREFRTNFWGRAKRYLRAPDRSKYYVPCQKN